MFESSVIGANCDCFRGRQFEREQIRALWLVEFLDQGEKSTGDIHLSSLLRTFSLLLNATMQALSPRRHALHSALPSPTPPLHARVTNQFKPWSYTRHGSGATRRPTSPLHTTNTRHASRHDASVDATREPPMVVWWYGRRNAR